MAKLVPKLESLTYHFSGHGVSFKQNNSSGDIGTATSDFAHFQNPWSMFQNLSILSLTNIIGSELEGSVLKHVGKNLAELQIDNIGLWDVMVQQQHRSHPQNEVEPSLYQTIQKYEDGRINLFSLGILAPNLKRLCMEMGHYKFEVTQRMPNDHHVLPHQISQISSNEKCDNICQKVLYPNLKELHIKGISSTSSAAMKEMLCCCQNLEELILLTKPPYFGGTRRQRFRAEHEYELCNIMNEDMLTEILQRNSMKFLKTFIASTVEPYPSGCRLRLGKIR